MFDIESIGHLIKQKMHLEDWDISIKLLNSKEMKKLTKINGYAGYCELQKDRSTAFIYINNDSKDNQTEKQRYFNLVHEFIHILCWVYVHYIDEVYPDYASEHSSYRVDMEEKMINSMARIFVEAYPLEILLK